MKQQFLFPEFSEDDGTIHTVYKVSSYGTDFDVQGLVNRLNQNKIRVPDFQRQYVWDIAKASRFIESLLLGLPVPGVFLTKDTQEHLEIVDGQQRLLTLQYFYNGTFKPDSKDKKQFILEGVGNKFADYSYTSLPQEDKNRLDDTPIHATIIKQEAPEQENNSLFYIFERLNSGGVELTPQEIRSAIYPGTLRDFIKEINKNTIWRKALKSSKPDERQRDEETLLRFIAFYSAAQDYKKSSLTEFLNKFMQSNKNISKDVLDKLKKKLLLAFEIIDNTPIDIPNVASLEAIVVAIMHNYPINNFDNKLQNLLTKPSFQRATSQGTGSEERVRKRLEIARDVLK